jgi:hypothetical protein
MNVKQRHDTKRNIFLGKSVGVRDIGGGNGQIKMPQRHALGTPSASTGVKDQRSIVSCGLGCGDSGGSANDPDVALFVHFHGEDRDLPVRCGRTYKLRSHGRTQQNAGVRVP